MTTLQDLADLPGINSLLEYTKRGSYNEEYSELFDWITSKSSDTHLLSKEEIIEIVVKNSRNEQLAHKIKQTIIGNLNDRSDAKQINQQAELIRSMEKFLEIGEFNYVFLQLNTEKSLFILSLADFILDGKANSRMNKYFVQHIIDPDKVSDLIVNDLNIGIKECLNWFETVLRSYLGEDTEVLAKWKGVSIDELSLVDLLNLYGELTNENVQNIIDYVQIK